MLRGPALFLATALPLAGCGLISDFHTAGYTLVDSGSQNCTGANQCDAGEVCCVSTLSPAAASCRAAPCANIAEVPFPVQLCQADNECGSAQCFVQSCQLLGQSIDVQACGVIAICSATPIDADVAFDSAPPPIFDASVSPPSD
jgi:hypothetical protein